jgi:very-short-patch-repair endonuclease
MQATKDNRNLYNNALKTFAGQNRKQMTKAEACLWKYVLKASQTGFVFKRQRPVLNYIADFMCTSLKLIIEVDGYTHLLEEVIINDKIRQTNLENAGFTVIRFKDEEVLKEIDAVKNKILATIKKLEKNM